MLELSSPVTALPGIGPAREKCLRTLGLHTIYDLIADFPRRYEDRSHIVAIADLQPGESACIEAIVAAPPRTARIRRGMEITSLTVADHSAKLSLRFFNQKYAAETLQYGETYYFYGALSPNAPTRQMVAPVFERADAPAVQTRRIVPVYSLTAGLSGKVLARTIRQALDACLPALPEVLPQAVRERYGLCGVAEAYRNIHDPADEPSLERARRRLIFEEFFVFSAGLQLLRARRTAQRRTPYPAQSLKPFCAALPFPLTGAQKRAMDEIARDLQSGAPMNRMLQGDVGSGKTVVAAAAAYLAVQGGEQAAFMAPTEILAEQHYRSLAPLLARFGIRTALLTGAMKNTEKAAVRAALAAGETQVVIGTHALLTEQTSFLRLGLVIADEQHRFGVAQRGALAAKGEAPHLLVMSATPIPRTMTLVLYGDLDVSILDELPPGRQKVETFLVGEPMRERINAFIRRQVTEGHQVYIVCPAIEEDEQSTLKSAEAWAGTLQQTVFPDCRVALLHGRMKGAEKDAVMRAFAAGESDILVATTVIEVGVDVPNATLIVIENAERFGLSQLHQLRGRVGRGSAQSYCVLFSSNKNELTRERLKALCATNDGFRIAEQDLALRGPGDFLGSRQHGLPAFKAANLSLDLPTLSLAREAAEACLADGSLPEREALLARIGLLFDDGLPVLN